MFHKKKAAPVAALGLTAALLLAGCGQAATDSPDATASATAEVIEQVDATTAPQGPTMDLNTAVPDQYKAAAEAGEGWAHPIPPNGSSERPLVGGYLLTLYAAAAGEEISLTGINANTGETAITTTLPGSALTGAEMDGLDYGPKLRTVHYRGKDYATYYRHVIIEDSDGLSKQTDGVRVYFVEMTDGAEATHFDVAGDLLIDEEDFSGSNGWTIIEQITDPDANDGFGAGEIIVATPEGPQAVADYEGYTPAVFGVTATGEGIRMVESEVVEDEDSWLGPTTETVTHLTIGDWTVPESAYSSAHGQELDGDTPEVQYLSGDHLVFESDSQMFLADAATEKVHALCEETYASDLKSSPDGRYVLAGGQCLLDTKTGESHSFQEDEDRKDVYARAVTDDGLVYGLAQSSDDGPDAGVTYEAATKEFTVADPAWEITPIGITPQGSLVANVVDVDGYTAAVQGVRLK